MKLELPTVEVGGFFKLEAVSPDGSVRTLADWFPNLVLNQGLDQFGTNTSNSYSTQAGIMTYVSVGTGSVAPAATDTTLTNFLASQYKKSATAGNDAAGRYAWYRVIYEYAVNAATGNLSEIGVGTSTVLVAKSLIKDGNGDPTTITVLSAEALRVSYELRVNIPTGNYLMTVDGYDIVIKAASADTWAAGYFLGCDLKVGDSGVGATIDDSPPNISGANVVDTNTTGAYTGGTYTLSYTAYAGVDKANYNINALLFETGMAKWQASVTPAIPKTSLKTLEIGYSVHWARAGEL